MAPMNSLKALFKPFTPRPPAPPSFWSKKPANIAPCRRRLIIFAPRACRIPFVISVESQILDKIKEADPELGNKIEEMMVVFESLISLSDRDIQTLLREVSSETLLVALRGAEPGIRNKIMGNMSKRAAELLRDDLEAMPPVKLSDVETAQKEIMASAKRLAEAGEITLGTKGEQLV